MIDTTQLRPYSPFLRRRSGCPGVVVADKRTSLPYTDGRFPAAGESSWSIPRSEPRGRLPRRPSSVTSIGSRAESGAGRLRPCYGHSSNGNVGARTLPENSRESGLDVKGRAIVIWPTLARSSPPPQNLETADFTTRRCHRRGREERHLMSLGSGRSTTPQALRSLDTEPHGPGK